MAHFMMKFKGKGSYGYIRQQKILTILSTLLLFALALGFFFVGYYTTGTKKNLFTVVAILGILPAAKSMVRAIMFLRYASLKKDTYDLYAERCAVLPVLYENILTTSQRSYFVPLLVYANRSLAVLCEDAGDPEALQLHLHDSLKTAGSDVTVKVFTDSRLFFKRVDEMSHHGQDQELLTADSVFSTIKALSL